MVSSPPRDLSNVEIASQRAALMQRLANGEVVLAGTATEFAFVDYVTRHPGVAPTVGPMFEAEKVQGVLFFLVEGGYFMFVPMLREKTYEAHLAFLPDYRGKKIIDAGNRVLDVLGRSGHFKNLVARFDYGRREIAWVVRKLGFELRLVNQAQQVWWKQVK